MMVKNDILLKLCSLLLQYPDREWLDRLPQVSAAVETLPAGKLRGALTGIVQDMTRRPPLTLQRIYTAAFDLTPATTLNLTYHGLGDNEKRAAALVHLTQLYADGGYSTIGGELPDFLPLMLEFLAVCPDAPTAAAVWGYMGDLDALSERLQDQAPCYAALLRLIGTLRPTAATTRNDIYQNRIASAGGLPA